MLDRSTLMAMLEPKVGKVQIRGNDLNFLCPFHKEKSPSAFLSLTKGIFKCFGCGAGYNIYVFCLAIGLSVKDSIPFYDPDDVMKRVHLPEYEDIHVRKESDSLAKGLSLFMEAMPASSSKPVQRYLASRLGLGYEIPFPVKYHEERQSLIFRAQTIVEKFLRKDAPVRYRSYGPVNLVYDENLKQPFETLTLVEGIFDFLKLYNCQYTHSAALLQVDITDAKLTQIGKLCKRHLFLGYDDDNAGNKAMHKYVNKLTSLGKPIFVFDLCPTGNKDWAECSELEIDEIMQNAMTYEKYLESNMDQYASYFGIDEDHLQYFIS